MKGGPKAHGFTIIETLIVLGISAVLFAGIAATLAGRQNRTEFDQSIQDVRTQLQQAINDIGSGFYPDTNNFRCTAPSFTSPPVIAAGSSTQGANDDCIFLGKALQFGEHGTNGTQIRSYTLAGLRQKAAGKEVESYADAMPVAVSPSSSNPSWPDATTKSNLQYGLKIVSASYTNTASGASPQPIGAFAIVMRPGSYSLATGSLNSGATQLDVIPIDTTAITTDTQRSAAEKINTKLTTSPVNPDGGVQLCFASDGSPQSGLITVGSNGRGLSVTLSIKENTTCS